MLIGLHLRFRISEKPANRNNADTFPLPIYMDPKKQLIKPIAIQDLAAFPVNIQQISPWKMNLIAVWEDGNLLFIASGDTIKAFTILPDHTLKDFALLRVPPNPASTDGAEVNYIRIGMWTHETVLVAVTMDAQVVLFPLCDLSQSPVLLNNYSDDFDDNSTWSVSVQGNRVAAGSNSHTIQVWNGDEAGVRFSDEHEHNVPCLEFSPGGRFLASTSIDSSLIVWSEGQAIVRCIPSRQWGWGVRWVLKADFLRVGANSIAQGCDTNKTSETLQDYVLVHTSQSEVRLLTFEKSNHPQISHILHQDATLFGNRRFSLLEVIPHLSLLLVGEWGGTELYFFRLVLCEDEFRLEQIDLRHFPGNLISLAVSGEALRCDVLTAHVYCLMLDGSLHILELVQDCGLNLPAAWV